MENPPELLPLVVCHLLILSGVLAGKSTLSVAVMIAQLCQWTAIALGIARGTDISAMQDKPVMRVELELVRYDLHQLVLHLADGFASGEASTVGEAENMGIDGDDRVAKHRVENHIGGLAPDSGQCLERLA